MISNEESNFKGGSSSFYEIPSYRLIDIQENMRCHKVHKIEEEQNCIVLEVFEKFYPRSGNLRGKDLFLT